MTDAVYTRIVRHWQRPVFRILASITGQPSAVEELAQQTFADAHAALTHLKDENDLERTLFRIAKDIAVEHLRAFPPRHPSPLHALDAEDCALMLMAEVLQVPETDLCFIFRLTRTALAKRRSHLKTALAARLAATEDLALCGS
jgi:DNA-directed RNA polymerase specialized sigma24 family protein